MGDQIGKSPGSRTSGTKCVEKDMCWYSGTSISSGELSMSNCAGPLVARIVTNGIKVMLTQNSQGVDVWPDHGVVGMLHN